MNNSASASRRTWNRVMNALVWASAVLVIVLVAGILGMVLVRGIPHISWKFLTTTASVLKGTDGILPAILNTLYVILLTLLIVLPLGVGAAVYLTEYAQNRKVISVIEFTNETLAGIPSIIYGLVGMLVFAQTLGFQTCLLSGSLTLVIMNLPTIIRTTQESLKTASWPWAASWAKAPRCSSPPVPPRSLPTACSRPTPPTVPPCRCCSTSVPLRTAISTPPGPLVQCCWCWCLPSIWQPGWPKPN